MILLLLACTKDSDEWTYPEFSGDGLASSEDTNHDDPSRDGDTSGTSGDSGDTAGSSFPALR